MNAPASRPAPRRGLGRGLGSLIPTAPPAGEDAGAAPADSSEGPVLQTVAGKMIFSNLRDVADEEEELMDRNLRSYYRDRGPRRPGRPH